MAKLTKELRIGIHNSFEIEVLDAKTGKVKQKVKAFNVVTNGALNTMCGGGAIADTLAVGRGTGTPSSSDTALFSQIGTKGMTKSVDNSRRFEGILIKNLSVQISNTEYNGETITELGLTTGSTLCSHAMLQDMNGNPISIAKTNTDVLNIYAKWYLHFDQSGEVTMTREYWQQSTSTTDYFVSILGVPLLTGGSGSWGDYNISGSKGTRYAIPTPFASMRSGDMLYRSSWTSDTEHKTATMKYPQVTVNQYNFYGIGGFEIGMWISNYSEWYSQLFVKAGGTLIPPSRVTGESVGVGDGSNTKFKTKTQCPYNATVYVNGAAVQSGVTVNKYPCVASGTQYFFRQVYKQNVNMVVGAGTNYSTPSLTNSNAIEMAAPDLGVKYFGSANANHVVEGSNDGTTWTQLADPTANPLAAADAHYKYYRRTETNGTNLSININDYDGYNIVFDTAPANGDVITIDYTTDYVPKDSDHVLDFELTLQFGEYQPT